MRLRHIKNSENIVENSPYFVKTSNLTTLYNPKNLFNNSNPLCLEIGMGKGKFICETAKKNQDNNYIGFEKYATVCLKAITNYENIYLNDIKIKLNTNISFIDLYEQLNKNSIYNLNLKYCCANADNLLYIFEPATIDTIFLNFSDPWPKNKDSNKRLTSNKYLKIYNNLLKNNGQIQFRTDNINLFNFSIEKIKKFGYDIVNITNDLNIIKPNRIMTEYEEKFISNGIKINELIAIKK